MYPTRRPIASHDMPKLQPLIIPIKGKHVIRQFILWRRSKRHWKLLENWSYPLPEGPTIVIPAGYEFDGASIPKILWPLLNPVGLLLIPSLIHDFAYEYGMLWALPDHQEDAATYIEIKKGAPQHYWDTLFREVAGQVNGFFFINYSAWVVLRFGGWWAWSRYRKRNATPPRPDPSPFMSLVS